MNQIYGGWSSSHHTRHNWAVVTVVTEEKPFGCWWQHYTRFYLWTLQTLTWRQLWFQSEEVQILLVVELNKVLHIITIYFWQGNKAIIIKKKIIEFHCNKNCHSQPDWRKFILKKKKKITVNPEIFGFADYCFFDYSLSVNQVLGVVHL